MIATSLAAVLALIAPSPQDAALAQAVPYASVTQTGVAYGQTRVLNDQDTALFRQGLAAARARDVLGAQSALSQIGDPAARKLVQWALIDTSGEQLSYTDLARAQTELAGWPRAESRREATEKVLAQIGRASCRERV